MDKIKEQQLRDKFFKEHTEIYQEEHPQIRKICTAPHDLFEWFKREYALQSKGEEGIEAIEFAKWISYADFEVGDISHYKKKGSNYSSEMLYDLFLKSKAEHLNNKP